MVTGGLPQPGGGPAAPPPIGTAAPPPFHVLTVYGFRRTINESGRLWQHWPRDQDDEGDVEGDDAGAAARRGPAAVPRARLRGDVARADRRGGRRDQGRHLRALLQQGGPAAVGDRGGARPGLGGRAERRFRAAAGTAAAVRPLDGG